MRLFNQAVLANQCWRLLNNPSLLISKILLPKYCSKVNFLKVKPHSNSSWAWKNILYGRDLIADHISWKVGNGESINLLHDRWIPDWNIPLSQLLPYAGPDDLTVSFLLGPSPNGLIWDMDKVYDLLPLFLAPKVLAISLLTFSCPDQYVWPYTFSGEYSTKSGYRSLYDQHRRSRLSSISSLWIHKRHNARNLVWNLGLLERVKVFI